MKSVNPNIYTIDYYLHECLGSEEFKASKGKKLHPRVKKIFSNLPISKNMNVLDIGSGRGDIALYTARFVKSVVGIDYSKNAITIANITKKSFPSKIQKKIKFLKMD